jgi:hypothetical protein
VQPARRAEPVALVNWPAGQSRQEVEPSEGWYLEIRQEVQTPASRYSPAAQPVQSARRTVPVPVVDWPAGQSRQVVEPEAGWYFELGQAAQAFKNAAVTLMSLCATQAPPSQASQVAVIRPGVAAVSTTLNQARLEV